MPRKNKTKSNRSKSYLRKTKNKTRRNKTRQRKYYMIGCNNKKCNCPCHRRKGGSSPIGGFEIKNGGGCVGPLVGSSYSVDSGGNYYNLPKAEAYSVGQNMKIRGGSILPTNLLNFTRQIEYGGQSLYNGLAGYKEPTNPAPYVQARI